MHKKNINCNYLHLVALRMAGCVLKVIKLPNAEIKLDLIPMPILSNGSGVREVMPGNSFRKSYHLRDMYSEPLEKYNLIKKHNGICIGESELLKILRTISYCIIVSVCLVSCKHTNTSKTVKRVESQIKPNLLVIFPDQFRAHSLGFMNEDPVKTPNLDKLARESVVFANGVANYPLCSPARGMFMTGKYPFESGIVHNCFYNEDKPGFQSNVELKKQEICWSDVLSNKGYDLGYIGKWHLTDPKEPFIDCLNNKGENKWNEWTSPENRHGFNYWYAYNTYDYHMRPLYWSTTDKREDFHYVDCWSPIVEANRAIEYLENKTGIRDSSKPFALVVAMNPPHDDGESNFKEYPEQYKEHYKDKTLDELVNRPNTKLDTGELSLFSKEYTKDYFSMVTGVDDQIGRILNKLDQLNLKKHTIVLLLSDHGEQLGSHDKRGKDLIYEEAMRIPLMIRYPDKLAAKKEDLMISIPDIYPTLLGLMGFHENIPNQVSGTNFSNYLFTGKGETPDSQLYINVGSSEEKGRRGLRTKQYSFVVDNRQTTDEKDKIMLFDNINDPYQMNNIASQHPQLIDTLKSKLKDWLKKTQDPFKLL